MSQTNILTWKSTYAYSKPVIPSIKLLVNNAWMANQLIYIQHGIWTYNGCQPCDDARQLQKTVGCYMEKAGHLIGVIFDPVLLWVSILKLCLHEFFVIFIFVTKILWHYKTRTIFDPELFSQKVASI